MQLVLCNTDFKKSDRSALDVIKERFIPSPSKFCCSCFQLSPKRTPVGDATLKRSENVLDWSSAKWMSEVSVSEG